MYRAEALNDRGERAEARGFRNGREAQRWALAMMPDATALTLFTSKGQARGWYGREGGTGDWIDRDGWKKSV